MKIKYPSFKISGSPTPNDKLEICVGCGTAYWLNHSTGRISYCCSSRRREATPEEYAAGKQALQKII
jgi:hypothetical protein